MEVKDSNGNMLQNGDGVVLIKSLDVKGSSIKLKKGQVIKNIRLTDEPDEIECRVEGGKVVLRTEFLRKN